MTTERLPRGLYAITDPRLTPDRQLVAAVEQAILGGAAVVQYRDKSGDRQRRRAEAEGLNALCRHHGVPLLINDDLDLADGVQAAGVHLGRDDPDPAEARARLGPQALIGVSCYDRLDLAWAAVAAGADYVAFGSVFPSPTKPRAVRTPIALLREAVRTLPLPVVAIGGITPANGRALVEAGVHNLAVISAVFGQPDVYAAAAACAALFKPYPPQDSP